MQIDVDERRHIYVALTERLRHVAQFEHFGVGLSLGENGDRYVGWSFDEFVNAIRVMTPCEAITIDPNRHDGRNLVATLVVGQWAPVEKDARWKVAADERQDARNGGKRTLGLAHTVAWQ